MSAYDEEIDRYALSFEAALLSCAASSNPATIAAKAAYRRTLEKRGGVLGQLGPDTVGDRLIALEAARRAFDKATGR